ncbi:acyl-coenzyme A thioesterase 1-like isoform X1 [Eriocheir sinensis]|uniref:acyl-coenzyme A thioesterase 1-like isoform X1 n=1 Tax=Eriocheir sinensis TaxID=95602 RepID=UPI0021C8102F|nr:acyl-coenzyme A thioesterase 1-like isoform X1 [Eriocheir sinensis]
MWLRTPLTLGSKFINGIKNVNSLRSAVNRHPRQVLHPTSGIYCNLCRAMSTEAVKVVVEPTSCLHDEAVSLSVDGLEPEQDITLEASMTDSQGVAFFSYSHYKANDNGHVDVNTMESLGGSYKGLFPMGPIATLSPMLQKHKYTRFFKKDVENPNVVTLSAFKGHLSHDELLDENRREPLSTTSHMRHYMAPGVQRIPVRYGSVRGSLFLPPGDGPFPGVIDLFGTAGGLLEYRSAQLASRGIASFAVGYFGYEDLPKSLEEFNIFYFEEAVQFLLEHEKIVKPNLGVIGVSKGADLGLSMATFIPEVTAAVSINGCISSVQSKLNLHNGAIPGLEFDLSGVKIKNDVMDCYEAVNNPLDYPETIIPIEKANADFLFLVSCDDRNWKSEVYADIAVERLEKAGSKNYQVHKYPQAGHLIEPPFSPFSRASYHKYVGGNLLWGGQLRPHIEAQVHAWEATLGFFMKHLQIHKGKL